jgi:hypothetical protein
LLVLDLELERVDDIKGKSEVALVKNWRLAAGLRNVRRVRLRAGWSRFVLFAVPICGACSAREPLCSTVEDLQGAEMGECPYARDCPVEERVMLSGGRGKVEFEGRMRMGVVLWKESGGKGLWDGVAKEGKIV